MPTAAQIQVHSAAAAIACALACANQPLTGEQCAAAATAAGYTRAAARTGLRWAVDVGIVTRSYGPRSALLYQLAGPPWAAGEVGELTRNHAETRDAQRNQRCSGGGDSSSPDTVRSNAWSREWLADDLV